MTDEYTQTFSARGTDFQFGPDFEFEGAVDEGQRDEVEARMVAVKK